jgi:hypothetical protein
MMFLQKCPGMYRVRRQVNSYNRVGIHDVGRQREVRKERFQLARNGVFNLSHVTIEETAPSQDGGS